MDNDTLYDFFLDCNPITDEGGAPVDCDPRLPGAPFTPEQLKVIDSERRLWSLVEGDDEEPPMILPGGHVVNVIAWYVTAEPATTEFPA